MRLYVIWSIAALILGIVGFLGLAAGIVGFVIWALAAIFLVLAIISFRGRQIGANPPRPRR